MADEAKPEKLTLWEAIKDLGWFPLAFAVIVGGPSILAILESVFVNHQLVPALQWIVDGYNRVMAVLGAVVEPLIQSAIDWVNARLNWNLTLDPVWRPVFALGMVFALALMRAAIRDGDVGGALFGAAFAIGSLAAALLVGVFGAGPGALAQGVVVGLPVMAFGLVWASHPTSRVTIVSVMVFAVMVIIVGARLSFFPGLARGGGLLAWGGLIAASGAYAVLGGLRMGDRFQTRLGLTILGGFGVAGLILAADFALKALGAG